jgi:hypothetical protein
MAEPRTIDHEFVDHISIDFGLVCQHGIEMTIGKKLPLFVCTWIAKIFISVQCVATSASDAIDAIVQLQFFA